MSEPEDFAGEELVEVEHDVDPQLVADHDETGLDLASVIAHAARGKKPGRKRTRRPDTHTREVSFSGAHADARDPRPLSEAFTRLTTEKGWTTEISAHLLLARWAVLVGPTNAAHSKPESYEDKVLVVRADSSAWASNLRLLAPQLVARLNEELGQGAVVRVVVKGPDAPSWKHGTRSVRDGRGPRDTYG